MAYRQPADRRDRSAELTSSSYLERFLEQVSTLPTSVQDTLDQIRKYDDRVDNLVSDAEISATATVSRSISKGMPLENARRSYFDMIQYQKSAVELSDKKIALAKNAHDAVDTIIADIDQRLLEFEAQLKKDGRWLPQGKVPVTSRSIPSGNQRQERAVTSKTPRSSQSLIDSAKKPIVPGSTLTTRTNKSRVRESTANVSRPSSGPTRAAKKASKNPIISSSNEEDGMEDAADSSGDAADTSTVDTQVYCFCRNVSHGEMICCDGKNCPYEWFHFECVGLTEAPKGSWLCDDCKREAAKARRKGAAGRRKTVS